MSFGIWRNGSFELGDSFQSAEWATDKNYVSVYQEDWHGHFLDLMAEARCELAQPCIFKPDNCPAFKGYLKPKGQSYSGEDETWIYFLKEKKYELVHIDDLRDPTDKEYNKIFRKLLNFYYPVIKSRESGSRMINGERYYYTEQDKYMEVHFKKRQKV